MPPTDVIFRKFGYFQLSAAIKSVLQSISFSISFSYCRKYKVDRFFIVVVISFMRSFSPFLMRYLIKNHWSLFATLQYQQFAIWFAFAKCGKCVFWVCWFIQKIYECKKWVRALIYFKVLYLNLSRHNLNECCIYNE